MITLTIDKQAQYVKLRTQSYNVKFTVVGNTRGPQELFMVWVRDGKEFFSHVASPVDTMEYGTDPTAPTDEYYRTREVILAFRCEADADEAIRLIKIDLDEYDRSTKVGETLVTTGNTVIGD